MMKRDAFQLPALCAASLFLNLALVGDAGAATRRPRIKPVDIEVGGSATESTPFGIDRIIVGNPAVVDVVTLPPSQILLTGKKLGDTDVTIVSRTGKIMTFQVSVSFPTTALQEAVKQAFPGHEIVVQSVGGSILLTGRAQDVSTADAVARLAKSMSVQVQGNPTGPEVVNLVEIVGEQQVQVQLKFMEISRTALRDMGFNAWYHDSGTLTGGMVGPPGSVSNMAASKMSGETGLVPPVANLPILAAPISGSFGIMFANGGDMPISATLSVLQSHGLAKTLSQPTLVAMNGQPANFLVGGEFPIPFPDSLGRVSVEFKDFGVQLEFLPTVLGNDTIQLAMKSAVSDLDASAGVTVSNVTVPGLTARQSATTIRLKNGQSFAIAGLLSDSMRSSVSKIPILGDIPILGMLFRSIQYRREETELVVLVTVNLVKPLAAGEVQPLPMETEHNDPGDLRLFLMGTIDAEYHEGVDGPGPGSSGEPAGSVGFIR